MNLSWQNIRNFLRYLDVLVRNVPPSPAIEFSIEVTAQSKVKLVLFARRLGHSNDLFNQSTNQHTEDLRNLTPLMRREVGTTLLKKYVVGIT